MIKSIDRTAFRREHLDNAIESARTESKYHREPQVRARANLAVAYVDLLDLKQPNWRDEALAQVRERYPEDHIALTNLIVRLHSFDAALGLDKLEFKGIEHV